LTVLEESLILSFVRSLDFGLGSRRGGLFPLLGEGIFTQDGRPWKHSRELLRRQFVRMQYQNLKVFNEHVNDLVTNLSSSSGIVDLQPAFFRFTLATTTALIFGEPVGSLGDEDQNIFANSFDYASLICAIRLRLADFHWAYTPSKFTKACGIVKEYANHFVKQALKDKGDNGAQAASGRYAFILDLYEELKDPALVRDQLVNVLIAGRDTTACLMSWTL
jgi:cytochrome P450